MIACTKAIIHATAGVSWNEGTARKNAQVVANLQTDRLLQVVGTSLDQACFNLVLSILRQSCDNRIIKQLLDNLVTI